MSFIRLLLIYKMQIKSGIVWIVVMKDHQMVMINFMCDEHFFYILKLNTANISFIIKKINWLLLQ